VRGFLFVRALARSYRLPHWLVESGKPLLQNQRDGNSANEYSVVTNDPSVDL
jgi:hypothetical protein